MDTWAAFMDFRDNVLKALEEARHSKLIGKSLEAKVTVYPNEQIRQLMTAVDADIAQLLIVSDFEVSKEVAPSEAVQFEDMAILVEKQKAKRVTVVVPFVKMSAQMKITNTLWPLCTLLKKIIQKRLLKDSNKQEKDPLVVN